MEVSHCKRCNGAGCIDKNVPCGYPFCGIFTTSCHKTDFQPCDECNGTGHIVKGE